MLRSEAKGIFRDTLLLGGCFLLVLAVFIYGWYSIYQQSLEKQEHLFQTQQELEVRLLSRIFADTLDNILNNYPTILQKKIDAHRKDKNLPGKINGGNPYVVSRGLFEPDKREVLFVQTRSGYSPQENGYVRRLGDRFRKKLENGRVKRAVSVLVKGDESFVAVLYPQPSRKDDNLAFFLVDLTTLIQEYLIPARNRRIGSGYLLNGKGRVIYGHKRRLVGRDILEMHTEYPEWENVHRRMLKKEQGTGEYFLLGERGGEVRKLLAWDTVDLGTDKLIVAVSRCGPGRAPPRAGPGNR